MFARLSLRLRIFLFFGLLAVGGAAAAGMALWVGMSRGDPVLTVALIFLFANTGLILAVWLLFDDNLAKPLQNLSAQLRLRAHSEGGAGVDTDEARYLGDLAHAAEALSARAQATSDETEAMIAAKTQALQAERARLTEILSEIPMAVILLNEGGEIVLYDSQAADILSSVAPPRLKARLADYFETGPLDKAMDVLRTGARDVPVDLAGIGQDAALPARLKTLEDGGRMLLIDVEKAPKERVAPRPLIYDFDLLIAARSSELADTSLNDLCYVAFDTETTGLSVEQDEIIQIGAVRVLGTRIIDGEFVDTFVDPGRPIPPASTRVHRISDADVAGAPDIAVAGRTLSHFASDAVLVAHNAPFDIGLLRKNAPRMGVDWSHPVLDTVLLSAVVFGINAQHSLDALCDRLGVEIAADRRHTALGDAEATAQALVRLLPLLQAKGIETFGQLVQQTRRHGRLLQDLNS